MADIKYTLVKSFFQKKNILPIKLENDVMILIEPRISILPIKTIVIRYYYRKQIAGDKKHI